VNFTSEYWNWHFCTQSDRLTIGIASYLVGVAIGWILWWLLPRLGRRSLS